jgi:prepilin-type N-terminal cleavage/methylation domain-containing protein
MQALLEAGAYELIYYPETSAKILLDEYVALAAEFFDDPELGFVNGTLQELADALRSSPARSGFTLMEMAVVLVVVGLMVGGVLVGQDMMRAADRNALIGEIEKVQHMVDTFRTKYESLPGDMPDAFNYWGATAACNNTSVATDNSGCNGDGDGQWDVANEKYRAWHHLDLADLAEGVWNRATSLASVACVPGQIGPELKVASRPMTIWFDYQSSANVLRISGEASTCPYSNATNTLNPADAYAIDDKIDDGLPTTGNFRSFSTTTCIDTTPNPDIYNVDVEQTWDCQPYVIYE